MPHPIRSSGVNTLVDDIRKTYGANVSDQFIRQELNGLFRGQPARGLRRRRVRDQEAEFPPRPGGSSGARWATKTSYSAASKNDPNTVFRQLDSQWETLKTAMGIAVIPVILPASARPDLGLQRPRDVPASPPDAQTPPWWGTFTALSGLAVIGGGLLIAAGALKLIGGPLGVLSGLAWPALTTGLGLLARPFGLLATLPLAGVATGLGLIVGALTALGSIVYHQEVASWIDKQAPGIGDALFKFTDGLSGSRPSSSNHSYVPPAPSGDTNPRPIILQVDGRTLGQVSANAWGQRLGQVDHRLARHLRHQHVPDPRR